MSDSPAAVADFIERMGLSAQADGLPRIAGRMLGYFVIHGGPASLGQLAADLQVSKASVSTNARILHGLGVLEATSVPGDRQDYYRLAERHYLRMLEGYVSRMATLRESLATAEDELPKGWDGARARLADMHNFVDVAQDHTRDLIDRLSAKDKGRDNGHG